jgi:NitT/TauT family transport system ATP-binding protein
MAGAAIEAGKARARTLIHARGVAKSYRTGDGEVESLRPLEFEVGEGEFVSVVGPSGCGKSTLLKLIAGLLPASRGSIEIGGATVDGPPPGIGIVFQSHVLLPWRTVLANILLQAEVRRLPREQSLARARDLVAMVGLQGFENKFPWQLSGGMQQRASICRALVHDPAILLMDEPFGALDELTRLEMNDLLLDIRRVTGATVLFVTHSISEAIYLSDQVLVFSKRPAVIALRLEIDIPYPRTSQIRYLDKFTEFEKRAGMALGVVK